MSQQTSSRKPILILDANAFISCTRLIQFGKTYRLMTTSSVLDELKDKKTKQYLQKLPYQIQQKYHDNKSLNFVKQFAKKTGDIGSLSDVDMELVALAYTIYKQEGFGNKLRKQPVPIVQKVVQDDNIQEDDQQDDDDEYEQQTKQQQKNNQNNNYNNNYNNNQKNDEKNNNNQNNNQDQQGWIKVPNSKKKQEEQDDSDMSDQQGWITPNNYHKKMAQINTAYLQKKQQPKKQQQLKKQQQHNQQQQEQQQEQKSQKILQSSQKQHQQQQFQIYLISADFSIQNIATQMGIKLLSLDGRVISSIRRFIWQCYLCWKQHKVTQNKVKLCSGCGYNSLSKIAYSLDMNGNAILHRKKGWKPNTTIQEWKEKKYEEQQRRKKHQHQRRTKKCSIFDTV